MANNGALPVLVKADLEMTAADHVAIGSTPPPALTENPQQTLAETMDDRALRAFLQKAVEATGEMYVTAVSGDARIVALFRLVRNRFSRDLDYLRDIGRIPPEFTNLDPSREFALPEE